MLNTSQREEETKYFAHSLPGTPMSEWELMHEHEERVATRCAQFLARLDPQFEPWGNLLGSWHDIGKYSTGFQNYISSSQDDDSKANDAHRIEVRGKVDHSSAAAQWSVERFAKFGRAMAYAFAGHHAGLPDWDDGESQSGLRQRLEKSICDWKTNAPDELKQLPLPQLPAFPSLGNRPITAKDTDRQTFRIAFWIRMLFSCLVDADFLATEAFMSLDRSAQRPANKLTMAFLAEHLSTHIDDLAIAADDGSQVHGPVWTLPVSRIHQSVLRETDGLLQRGP